MELTPNQIAFREGMSRMGAAVNLITSDGISGTHGIVASAVCSVTDTPPTLLVCVNRNAFVHDKFLENGVLCVNVLAAHHQDLCRVFARYVEGVDRFSYGDWLTLSTGSPVLSDANVAFDCRIGSVLEQGSHSVMFCEIKAVHLPEKPDRGLVYFSRDYHHLETGKSQAGFPPTPKEA
ncbi:FMN reductase (NADH) RutF [Thalassovita gelatinovora]|uniref:FMN reductase (NADH) RutF n=1 Tax=Thalassovita gelatinovora TaxID=53501 RepID=A0A0P1FU24_THAGE|nr:flavin reductase [Thalassovita gelatinovora]QIZ80719.1 flavin reductase [Thalassovita gelatinovora]CUH65323.1 FMN reductase (NADH) RutF [Thalassovita gelatinovora]SEQ89374.1 flavin reductase [Thalassovita gelatinovora]